MTTCCLWKIITWLTYTQQGGVQVQILRRWEYRGRADEHHKHAHPEPQRYPSFQLTLLFTGGRSICPPEILVPRLSVTDRRALVRRCVSPTHGQLASESWHCCAGRRQAEGDWAWTHKMVSSSWAPRCWVPGRASSADRAALPGTGVRQVCWGSARTAPALRASGGQWGDAMPEGRDPVWERETTILWLGETETILWFYRVRGMATVHPLASSGWREGIVPRRQDSMIYEEN